MLDDSEGGVGKVKKENKREGWSERQTQIIHKRDDTEWNWKGKHVH